MVLSFLLVKAQNTHPVVQNLWKVVAKIGSIEFVCKACAKLQAKALCCKKSTPVVQKRLFGNFFCAL